MDPRTTPKLLNCIRGRPHTSQLHSRMTRNLSIEVRQRPRTSKLHPKMTLELSLALENGRRLLTCNDSENGRRPPNCGQNGRRILNYTRQCRKSRAQLQTRNCLGPLKCIRKWPRTSQFCARLRPCTSQLHSRTALELSIAPDKRSQTSQMHWKLASDLLIGLDNGFRPLNCARKWPQTSKLHPKMALNLDPSSRTASDLSMALENDLGPINCPRKRLQTPQLHPKTVSDLSISRENRPRLLNCTRKRPRISQLHLRKPLHCTCR
jgi:hypothetical protein